MMELLCSLSRINADGLESRDVVARIQKVIVQRKHPRQDTEFIKDASPMWMVNNTKQSGRSFASIDTCSIKRKLD